MAGSNGAVADNSHLYMQITEGTSLLDEGHHFDDDFVPKEKTCCQSFVETACFQMSIGAVIVANAVVIGMETDMSARADLFQPLEDTFLLIFLLELLLKLSVYGCFFFSGANHDLSWNFLDFGIVFLGVTDRIVSHITSHKKGSGARFFVLLMRTFRLLRLLRIIRIFRLMKQLYLLANSIMEAFSAVLWVSVLCFLIIYVCAIVITRLVGQPVHEDGSTSDAELLLDEFRVEHFGNVMTSMLTLFRLMTFPDMEEYKPIYKVMPGMEGFLIGFIIFMAFAMVSLLTGVITESLLDKGKRREDERRFQKEQSRRVLAKDVRIQLQERDGGSGVLNRHQFEKAKDEVIETCSQHGMQLRAKDLDALFELVDDGSGTIDAEELLYGMVQLNSEVRPMAIMELRRLVVRGIHGISEQTAALDARMQTMDRRMIELLAAARFGAVAAPTNAEAARPALPTQGLDASPMLPPPAAVDLLGSS